MDYYVWSQEYYEEAQKIERNIEKLKQKLPSVPSDQRRTVEDSIHRLRMLYYEVMQTAGYLASMAKERSDAA